MDESSSPAPPAKNLMTPEGHAALQAEYHHLWHIERPRIVEIVSWAASNGDRSENGDYLYNKKRLREIDRRVRYLTKQLDSAEVVDPQRQKGLDRVFFGATVTYLREIGTEMTVKLVGVDEANMTSGKINWQSPVARALWRKAEGDIARVKTDAGEENLEIIAISYMPNLSAHS